MLPAKEACRKNRTPTRLLFVGTAGGREQQVVKVESGVAAVAGLAERVRPIRVGGDCPVGAAEVGRHHLLGWCKRWTKKTRDGGSEGSAVA